jgi:DNA/RNA-binding domain of Phe-tRNA-synthetase-like protein
MFREVRVGTRNPMLHSEIVREAQTIKTRFEDANAIRTLPKVVAFRELLRQVGVNPRREQPSVERLLTYAHKRGDLPAINSLVDAYNLVSIRSLCSLGAHDLDAIDLPVSLRLLTSIDTFTPLGSEQPMLVNPREFGYVDARGRVLCRLDILQAAFSKVTTSTRNVLLIVEGTASHPPELLRQTVADVIGIVTQHCGGTAEVAAMPS